MIYRVLGLFSGIGGFELGLQRAGMEIAAMCEIDPYCRRVLRKHWARTPIYEDVRELTAASLRRDGIAVNVISGGFPCQGLSEAGRRGGFEDERSALWEHMPRLADELGVDYLLVENVPELLSGPTEQPGAWFGRVLGDLAAIGYDAEWHCIPACAVDADHIRDRVWIIAYPNSARAQIAKQRRRKRRAKKMGQDAPLYHADDHRTRLPRGMQTGALREDARAISPWLGLALASAPPFPREYRTCAPVLGRGEDGIPDRMDRVHAIGNAVVPQIPELIGRAILQASGRGLKASPSAGDNTNE